MDPNANLDELLILANGFLEAADEDDEEAREPIDVDVVIRMAELVTALDGWIRGGGFLPTQWKREK